MRIGSDRYLCGVLFKSLPEEGDRLRGYVTSILPNRTSSIDPWGETVDFWADPETLIEGRRSAHENSYSVEVMNWKMIEDIGHNFNDRVQAYLDSWEHRQREEPNRPCTMCKGARNVVREEQLPCTNCGGDGKINVKNPDYPGFLQPLYLERKCTTCSGQGTTLQRVSKACPICGGTGRYSE